MSTEISTLQLQALFTYPFKDDAWVKKLVIGILLIFTGFIIPLLPLILVFGYIMRIMDRIINQEGDPYLPEWDDWGKLFVDGARLLAGALVYSLPVLLFFFAGYMITFLPAFIFPLLEIIVNSSTSTFAIFTILGMLFGFGLMGLGFLLAFAFGLIVPAGLAHLVAKDRFAAAFQFNQWWPVFRINFTGFLIAFVISFGLLMIGTLIFQIIYFTIILCCLIPVVFCVFSMYVALVLMPLYAVAYRDGVHKLSNE